MRFLLTLLLAILSLSASAQDSSKVKLLGSWTDTAHVRVNQLGQRYNDVWGFVMHGKEYAAIGSVEGVHIIDVNTAKEVAAHRGNDTITRIIHRDYKTYRNYLYAVCDEGRSSLQVFDLSYLPDSLHLVYESNPQEFALSHNIFVDTARGTLYACSVKSLSGTDYMRVYSLAKPDSPALIVKYNLHDFVHDVYVRNDTAFCSSGFYGYQVVDFTDHTGNWQYLGEMHFYPYQGYNHSSWIGNKGFGVMADETHGLPLKVIDARNLSNMKVLSTFIPRNDSTCIPHNPYIVGDFVFISYYMDGLQIYDISDPYNPKQAGYYDTYTEPDYKGFAGAWGCYPFLPSGKVLLSDMQRGLFVFDVSEAIYKKDTTVAPPDNPFSFYPNPATGYIKMFFPKADTGTVALELRDLWGRFLWKSSFEFANYTIQPIQVNLPAYLPAGTYFLTTRTGQHIYKEKILKK